QPAFYVFDGEGPLAGELAAAGIPHALLPRRPGVDWAHARALGARLSADGAGLVHCHNATALFLGSRAARRAARLPALSTARGRGRPPVLYPAPARASPAPSPPPLLPRWLARGVTPPVPVSRRLTDAPVRGEGSPPARTEPLLNGCADPRTAYDGDRARARA